MRGGSPGGAPRRCSGDVQLLSRYAGARGGCRVRGQRPRVSSVEDVCVVAARVARQRLWGCWTVGLQAGRMWSDLHRGMRLARVVHGGGWWWMMMRARLLLVLVLAGWR